MCREVVVPTLGIPTLWSVFSFLLFFKSETYFGVTSCFYKMPVNIKRTTIHPSSVGCLFGKEWMVQS